MRVRGAQEVSAAAQKRSGENQPRGRLGDGRSRGRALREVQC